MKLATERKVVEVTNTQGGGKFSIKATAKAFAILSSGLYSDKILAIVRELCCNAYDAHVSANKADLPFEIQLPTDLNPTFHVKDFGVGLDDHQVRGRWVTEGDKQVWEHGIYTTFFDSSKADSNDYIGALGLGSKSPFSYGQTFFVTSRFNGIVRTYSMFINQDGEPEVQLMTEEPTEEGNGVCVELAVKKDDIIKFRTAAKRALMYFKPMPVVKGCVNFQPFLVKHLYGDELWKIRHVESDADIRGPYVVQGFVSYPIDFGQLPESLHDLRNINLDIYVPIGDVDVAASREQLSYVKSTIANLTKYLETVATNIRDMFQQQIDKRPTLWEARKLHEVSRAQPGTSDVYKRLDKENPFLWKGVQLHQNYTINLSGIDTINIIRVTPKVRRYTTKLQFQQMWNKESLVTEAALSQTRNTIMIVDNVVKGSIKLAEHAMDIANSDHAYVFRLENKKPDPATVQLQAEQIENIRLQFGEPTLVYLSEYLNQLGKGGETRPAYKAKAKDEFYIWKGFRKSTGGYRDDAIRTFSSKCWTTEKIDVSEGGFYVQVSGLSVIKDYARPDFTVHYIDRIIAAARGCGVIASGTTIYGVNEKRYALIKGNPKWINLFDHINSQWDKLIPQIQANAHAKKLQSYLNDCFVTVLNQDWSIERFRNSMTNCPLKDTLDLLLAEITDTHDNDKQKSLLELYDHTPNPNHVADLTESYQQKGYETYTTWCNEYGKYPMLRLVDWESISRTDMEAIIEYVNAIIAVHGIR